MKTRRIDQLTRKEKQAIQRELIRTGFLDPYLPSGDPADDGIWGPYTAQAYARYLQSHLQEDELSVSPAPVGPWWASKGIWGSLLTIVSALAGLIGYGFDPKEATEVIMPLVDLLPLILAALGGLISWWGRRNAKAPIDKTLIARINGRDLRFGRMPLQPEPQQPYADPRGRFGE